MRFLPPLDIEAAQRESNAKSITISKDDSWKIFRIKEGRKEGEREGRRN